MTSKKKKGTHKISKEEKQQRRAIADQHHAAMANTTSIISTGILSKEATHLFSKIGNVNHPNYQPVSVATDAVQKLAKLAGTNLEINKNDPYGDGDQSPVGKQDPSGEPQRQILRTLFSEGGDLGSYLRYHAFSPFGMACALGDAKLVLKMLQETSSPEERMKLLECRQSGMRMTPLILTVALSKVVEVVSTMLDTEKKKMDHLEVIKVLLRYGARPDSKEITGKTVAHYGAGSFATTETLQMVDFCYVAYQTSHCFGKKVVLRNMKSKEFNGATGTLGGYVADSKRRQVILDHEKGEFAIPPTNIFLISNDDSVECSITDGSRNLINIQDRMGTISLHEVFFSSRIDVVDFLIQRHVSIDVEDGSGWSVNKLACMPSFVGISQMSETIRKYSVSMAKDEQNLCWNCKETAEKLSACSRCKKANYCSRECQKKHWTEHKAYCKPPNDYTIQIQKPKFDLHAHTIHSSSGKISQGLHFERPDGVKPDEPFWIKVQCNSIYSPHMVYDKTRSLLFYLHPDEPGHSELFNKVSQEKAFDGRKAFFEASFDSEGNLKVYPNSVSMKSW